MLENIKCLFMGLFVVLALSAIPFILLLVVPTVIFVLVVFATKVYYEEETSRDLSKDQQQERS